MLSASGFNRVLLEDEGEGSGKGLLLLDLRRRSLVKHEPAIETLAKFMPLENGLLLYVMVDDAYMIKSTDCQKEFFF